MTDQQIRIAVAEACGWKCINERDKWFLDPGGHELPLHMLPRYSDDLNAMHSAEELLDGLKVDDRSMYYDYLLLIAADTDQWRTVSVDKFEREWVMLRTTARQRAEAFLRTLGKWKD